jgi:hypothetical protein
MRLLPKLLLKRRAARRKKKLRLKKQQLNNFLQPVENTVSLCTAFVSANAVFFCSSLVPPVLVVLWFQKCEPQNGKNKKKRSERRM